MSRAIRTAYAVAFLGTYIAVLVASLLPTSALPEVRLSDKIEHFVAYAVLAVLGGIYLGVFTPVEAAAVGALLTVCLTIWRRKLNW